MPVMRPLLVICSAAEITRGNFFELKFLRVFGGKDSVICRLFCRGRLWDTYVPERV